MGDIYEMFESLSSDTILWRYMGLLDLLNLLKNHELIFPSVSLFIKDDPWEGSFSNLINNDTLNRSTELTAEQLNITRGILVKNTYVNCWHINESESDAMWKIYSKDKGVAVATSISSLKKTLEKSEDRFYIGKIEYENVNQQDFALGNTYEPFFRKRILFEHEKEYRIVFWNHHEVLSQILSTVFYPSNNFTYLNPKKVQKTIINPQELVKKVILHPKYRNSEIEIVEDIIKKYGYSIEIETSNILSSPDY